MYKEKFIYIICFISIVAMTCTSCEACKKKDHKKDLVIADNATVHGKKHLKIKLVEVDTESKKFPEGLKVLAGKTLFVKTPNRK